MLGTAISADPDYHTSIAVCFDNEGLALAICLFSLAGVPPFIGFAGKFVVFRAAVNSGLVWLAVLGVLNSLISAFYYLRVVYVMYMQPLPRREPEFERSVSITAVAAAPPASTIWPAPLS